MAGRRPERRISIRRIMLLDLTCKAVALTDIALTRGPVLAAIRMTVQGAAF
jgi:hypothetical protein